jgi:hypothetical protein
LGRDRNEETNARRRKQQPGHAAGKRERAGDKRPAAEELMASLLVTLTPQPEWKASASHNAATSSNAFTFLTWNAGAPQQPGMWFQVELPESVALTEIQFESTAAGGRGGGPGGPSPGFGGASAPGAIGYPRGYTVTVSTNGTTWSAPVATGEGTGQTTVISFPSVQAKFVRITQTAATADAPPLSIQRLRFFAAAPAGKR